MPLGTDVDLGPGHIVSDTQPPERGTATPTFFFRPMSIVAKRSPISATAKHLHCWAATFVQAYLTRYSDRSATERRELFHRDGYVHVEHLSSGRS